MTTGQMLLSDAVAVLRERQEAEADRIADSMAAAVPRLAERLDLPAETMRDALAPHVERHLATLAELTLLAAIDLQVSAEGGQK